MKNIFLLMMSLLWWFDAYAGLQRELYQGVEPLAMGNAYVAIAEDEHAIFYNPAGVAAYRGIEFHLVNLQATVSEDALNLRNTLKDLDAPTGSDLNQFMGQNISGEASGSAVLMAPYFGVAALYDLQAGIYAKNQSFPKIEYGFQKTSGVQVAFGFSTQTGKRRGFGKRNRDYMSEWRFGIAGKMLSRQGGYHSLTPIELTSMDSNQLKALVGGKGSGYSGDVGLQRFQKISKDSTLHLGVAFSHIGGIQFGGNADALHSGIAAGVGWTQNLGVGAITLAYDARQLNQDADWRKKQHIGVRYSFPILVDLYAGLNQTYLTYGASVDVWLAKVSVATYREELGSLAFQNPERRYTLRVDLKFHL